MIKIINTMEEFLKKNGRLKAIKLGSDQPEIPKDEIQKNTDEFIGILKQQLIFNQKILVIYIIILCCLFSIGIGTLIYFLAKNMFYSIINGGLLGIILFIGERMRRVWKEKTILDIITTLRPSLKPEDVTNFVEILYRKNKRKKIEEKSS